MPSLTVTHPNAPEIVGAGHVPLVRRFSESFRRYLREHWLHMTVSLAAIALVFGAWWLVTSAGWVSDRTLPSPGEMGSTFATLYTQGYDNVSIWTHIYASLRRTLIGFAIGVGLAIPFGLAIGTYSLLSAAVSPVLAFLRPIPPIAYYPLMILFFGIGDEPKIIMIAAAAFFYMVLNVASGVRGVPRDLILAARMLGLSRRQIFGSVVFRSAMPQIIIGANVSLILSWSVVVAAELMSSNTGVGFMATNAATFFRVPFVYAAVVIIGAIGVLFQLAMTALGRPLLKWHGR